MKMLRRLLKLASSNKSQRDRGYCRGKTDRKMSPNLPVDYKGSFAAETGAARHMFQTVLSGFFYASLMLLTGLIILWFIRQMTDVTRFTIHRVQFIAPVKHLHTEDLRKMSLPFTGENFFAVDIRALKERLSQLPWVYHVRVSRVWPDRLSVHIKEQTPIARWQGNQLINKDLNIFTVPFSTLPKNLPEFKGTTGQLRLMWQNYQAIEKILLPVGLHTIYVELSNRRSWRLKLDNGLTLILGRSDGLDHLKRFVEVYNQVITSQNIETIDYIDLRYTNGMAVKTH